MVAKATKFLYLEDESCPNNVSTKFQLDWPANNRIIAGSLFSQFFRVFVFRLFKMLGNTAVVATATKFLYLEDEY